jgi:hypothetical protein
MRGYGSRGGAWRRAALTLGVVGLVTGAAAVPAQARVGVFFGFGPFWGAPAYYYPPPFYYPPPPVYYTPAPPVYYTPPSVTYTPPFGGQGAGPGATVRSCYAGAYVCPLETRLAPGTTCWCPDNRGGRAYGRAG